MPIDRAQLPRLLYVADVPVAATVAGSILMYRLLEPYPREKLLIAESELTVSPADKRLPAVRYATFPFGNNRLLHSRLTPHYLGFLEMTAPARRRHLRGLVKEVRPEAILTVSHRVSWRTAQALAKECGLPYFMMVHDDVVHMNPWPKWRRAAMERDFADAYRGAAERFCVSPYMAQAYRERYGVAGRVMYPSRAADATEYDAPPERVRASDGPVTFVYAGSLDIPGYVQLLVKLADALRPHGANLLVHCTFDAAAVRSAGLDRPNVKVEPLVPAAKLVEHLRERAHVLVTPMTFEPHYRMHMQTGFPSKLTEYTASGVPMLVWGPPDCSAVVWAKQREVAEVLDTTDESALAAAVQRLAGDGEYRYGLGRRGMEVGRRFFGYTAAEDVFLGGLLQGMKR
jgi:glycosyltransferase involved in cell wall biosynthesis